MDFRNCILSIFLALNHCWNFSTAGNCDLESNADLPFCNPSLSIDERVRDLVARIPITEMGMLMVHNSSASATVGLEEYNWWNEALHGVARGSPGARWVIWEPPTEFATSFPQIIHLASSFNQELYAKVATAIGDEGRAFYNAAHAGLTFWGPNVNIYRDPRWGRGHEVPGEDPYLTSQYAITYIHGLQGAGPQQDANNGFLKTSSCCKHFAAHSSETDRISFNSIVTAQDMADTYLPAFKSCVEQGDASCIMCSFNAINGIPACANKELLTHTLREKWGFDGYITSDCGGVNLVRHGLNYTSTYSELIHAVLDAGLDLECETTDFSHYPQVFPNYLVAAILDRSVTIEQVEQALGHLFRTQMRLGLFEKEAARPYLDLEPELVVDSQKHKQLALEAARQSIVLLKNDANLLPLDKNVFNAGNKLALIGPHLNCSRWFLANYRGIPSHIDTPLESIVANYVVDTEYEFGCDITGLDASDLQAAENLARQATTQQIILFVGLNLDVEEESNDRVNITLTGLQHELITRVLSVATSPVILVLISGGGVDLTEYKSDPRVGAIVYAGYIGQAGGLAIADVIFGTYNPAARLTHTFYASEFLQHYAIGDMFMRPTETKPGRTYRFYQGQPVYEFGYGLSYTTFNYQWANMAQSLKYEVVIDTKKTAGLSLSNAVQEDCVLIMEILVTNVGENGRSGDHSVLWFLAPPQAGLLGRPLKSLVHFDRITNLQPNAQQVASICLNREQFELADEAGEFQLITGRWTLSVGTLAIDLDVLIP